ncbi:hypothetical protein HPG69_014091 [Diceros bicornis minor]|uniref:G-protein coupled receptors family 1 profile domain-containing protein n=1 Tax=Diceros bicornis minor TaxID=77932 RepID=A0A7J7EN52_DICBM|nr:hypothetical protein HPG69_014091 [Diceros bicornis minor]
MNFTSASKCPPEEVGCLHQLTMAVQSVSFMVGIVVNGLELWMTTFHTACTVTTVWFFNLALADFTHGRRPVALQRLGLEALPALPSPHFLNQHLLLVLLSVDHCISVLYPTWALNHHNVQHATWLAIGVWLLAAITCSPYLKFLTIGKWEGCVRCSFKFDIENEGRENAQDWRRAAVERHLAVTIIHFLLGFLVPLAILSTCAHLIRTKLRREG